MLFRYGGFLYVLKMFSIDFIDTARKKLGAIADAISKPDAILSGIASEYQKQINQSFDQEKDPDDNSPWAALSPAYEKEKQKNYPGTKKLVRTGTGKQSVRVVVKGLSIAVEHNEVMGYHRTGTRKMPKRNFVPDAISEPLAVSVVTRIVTAILKG